MKILKQIFKLLTLTVVMSSFSQCSSAQKLQKEAPTTFGDIYFEKRVSGIEEGPHGIAIYIEVKDSKFQLDSVYFRGKAAKLKKNPQNNMQYIGSFITTPKHKKDLIISSDPKQEYGNKIPEKPIKIPFELAYNECVVSYKVKGKTKYYKLTNVTEIHSIDVPMSPAPNNN